MGPSEGRLPEPGSIADTAARLALWSRLAPKGLARVEFSSEYSRLEVDCRLGEALQAHTIPFREIALPIQRPAVEVVRWLRDQLAMTPSGVVSIHGFSTAFGDASLGDSLRILNFNREALADFPLRQIWWMTPEFAYAAIHGMRDLDSWFLVKLHLSEVLVSTPREEADATDEAHPLAQPIEGMVRRAYSLMERFRRAKAIESDATSLFGIVCAAADAIHGAGVPRLTRAIAEELLESSLVLIPIDFNDTQIAPVLGSLALLLFDLGRIDEAEPLYRRALEIAEMKLGPDHPDTATSLNNLAGLLRCRGPADEAELLYRRALMIVEMQLGPDHRTTKVIRENLRTLLEGGGSQP